MAGRYALQHQDYDVARKFLQSSIDAEPFLSATGRTKMAAGDARLNAYAMLLEVEVNSDNSGAAMLEPLLESIGANFNNSPDEQVVAAYVLLHVSKLEIDSIDDARRRVWRARAEALLKSAQESGFSDDDLIERFV